MDPTQNSPAAEAVTGAHAAPSPEFRPSVSSDNAVVSDVLQILERYHVAPEDQQRLTARLLARSEELRRQENEAQKLAWVASHTDNAVILTDPQGRIEWVNVGFTRITGYTFAEVVGKKPGPILQGPETDQATVAFMRENLARGAGFNTEVLNYRKDGRPYWLSIEVQPIYDANGTLQNFMAIESDITERRESAAALRTQFDIAQALARGQGIPEMLRILAERMRWHLGVLWLLDAERERLVCAATWSDPTISIQPFIDGFQSRAFGRGEGLPGKAWNRQTPVWETANANAGIFRSGAAAQAAGFSTAVAVPVIADTRVLAVFEFFSMRSEAPNIGRLNALTAVTSQLGQFLERLKAEDALRRQAEDLLKANAELEQAAKMKAVFLASMSHELRTPLTGILGMSETLLEQVYGALNEKQVRYVSIIENSGRQLLALINDLLELSRIEAGREELSLNPCTIDDLCVASLEVVKPLAERRRQTVDYKNEAGTVRLRVDIPRMEKVLTNLLGNAAKFTPECGEFGLRVALDGDAVRFTVWDRGIGIAPEDMGRLFQPFVQLDARLARRYDGTGLGLALVKHLVEMHHGRVAAQSQLGVGSEFSVWMPVER